MYGIKIVCNIRFLWVRLPYKLCLILKSFLFMEFIKKPNYSFFIDIEWKNYGRLTVLWYAGKKKNGGSWWCQCSCWTIKTVLSVYLRDWSTKSCGCYQKEVLLNRNYSHGMSKAWEYRSYNSAKNRCKNIRNKAFNDYWWRGIKFKFKSFEEFYKHIWPRPNQNYSLDRINTDWNYEKWNIKWSNMTEQCNNRRSNILIEYNWETKTLMQWCKELWLKYEKVRRRIKNYNWNIEEAFK